MHMIYVCSGRWKWSCGCPSHGKFHSQSRSYAGLYSEDLMWRRSILLVKTVHAQELQSFTVTFRAEEVNKRLVWSIMLSEIVTCFIQWTLLWRSENTKYYFNSNEQEEKKHNFVTDSARSVSQWIEVWKEIKRICFWEYDCRPSENHPLPREGRDWYYCRCQTLFVNSSPFLYFCLWPNMVFVGNKGLFGGNTANL